jgi:hypothetical protein
VTGAKRAVDHHLDLLPEISRKIPIWHGPRESGLGTHVMSNGGTS